MKPRDGARIHKKLADWYQAIETAHRRYLLVDHLQTCEIPPMSDAERYAWNDAIAQYMGDIRAFVRQRAEDEIAALMADIECPTPTDGAEKSPENRNLCQAKSSKSAAKTAI